MPENENSLKVLILHHPLDDQAIAVGRSGEVSQFKKHLKLALGKAKPEVRVDSDFLAGTEKRKEVERFLKESALVVFVFSIDFFGDDTFLVEQFEAMVGSKQLHAVLYLRSCPYEGIVAPTCPILPGAKMPLDQVLNVDDALTKAATEIAGMLKDFQLASRTTVSPATKKAQKSALLTALLELNYSQQPIQFKRCTISAPVLLPAAFLVHGNLRIDGANWLISKLLRYLPDKNLKPWVVEAEGCDMSIDFQANGFLRKLTPYLELSYSATYAAICKAMFERLTTEHGTFVIKITGARDLLRSTSITAFQDFVDQFWTPLVQALQAHGQATCARLIVFFVADRDMDDIAHFAAYDPSSPTWKPIRLPRVDPFDQGLITNWLDTQDHVLLQLPIQQPTDLIQPQTRDQKIATILQNSQNGLPEMVLQHLCRECGVEFDDIISMITSHETEN